MVEVVVAGPVLAFALSRVVCHALADRRRDEEKVAYMAHHDLLTGVANRTYFVEKLADAAARLRRRDEPFTVMVLDLDWGGTTSDGRVTVEATYCLGLCACAPSAMLDGEPMARLAPETIDEPFRR